MGNARMVSGANRLIFVGEENGGGGAGCFGDDPNGGGGGLGLDDVGGDKGVIGRNGRFARLLGIEKVLGEVGKKVYLQRGGTLGHDSVAEGKGKRATALVGEGEEEVRGVNLISFDGGLERPVGMLADAANTDGEAETVFVTMLFSEAAAC